MLHGTTVVRAGKASLERIQTTVRLAAWNPVGLMGV